MKPMPPPFISSHLFSFDMKWERETFHWDKVIYGSLEFVYVKSSCFENVFWMREGLIFFLFFLFLVVGRHVSLVVSCFGLFFFFYLKLTYLNEQTLLKFLFFFSVCVCFLIFCVKLAIPWLSLVIVLVLIDRMPISDLII